MFSFSQKDTHSLNKKEASAYKACSTAVNYTTIMSKAVFGLILVVRIMRPHLIKYQDYIEKQTRECRRKFRNVVTLVIIEKPTYYRETVY